MWVFLLRLGTAFLEAFVSLLGAASASLAGVLLPFPLAGPMLGGRVRS